MDLINQHISATHDESVCTRLSEEALIDVYMECPSVKKNIEDLSEVMKRNGVDDSKISDILKEYIPHLIPAGTKGVIRGNLFNQIVKNYVTGLNLPSSEFEIKFESKHPKYVTTEIPDWYVYHLPSDTILVGMNQLDLWTGGQQLNRGAKYILDENLHSNPQMRVVSVVCSKITVSSTKNKVFKILETGFSKKRLCYLGELGAIIWETFGLFGR